MSQNGVSTIDLEKNLTIYHPLLTKYTKKNGKAMGIGLVQGDLQQRILNSCLLKKLDKLRVRLSLRTMKNTKNIADPKIASYRWFLTLYMKRSGRDGESFWAQVILHELTESSGRFQKQKSLSNRLD